MKILFKQKPSFLKNTSPEIIKEFRQRFLRVSMIMDCVICEKCRLWGKIQSLGIGTALKILFAMESRKRLKRLKLKNSEITSLLNTFARISESIEGVDYFRKETRLINTNCFLVLFSLISTLIVVNIPTPVKYKKFCWNVYN